MKNLYRLIVLILLVGGACYLQAVIIPVRSQLDVDGVTVRRVGKNFKLPPP